MLPRVFGPKEGQLSELDEDVEEDDSPPVAEIAEIYFGNEPTDGSEVVRDSTKGQTPVVDSTLTVVQSPDVKGQSTVGENKMEKAPKIRPSFFENLEPVR